MKDQLESLAELVALYRCPTAERSVAYSSEFLAAAICRETGRCRRVRAAIAEGIEWDAPDELRAAESFIRETPALVEEALRAIDSEAMVGAMRRYVQEHPLGEDEDEGLRLLFDYDCAHLVARVARDVREELSPAGRERLAVIERALEEIGEHVRGSPSAFRRVAQELAAYCEDWGVEPDHPMSWIVEACAPRVGALLAERAVAARESVLAPGQVETVDAARGRFQREEARTVRLADTLKLLRQAAWRTGGSAGALQALRLLLKRIGRVVPLEQAPASPPELGLAAQGAGKTERLARWVPFGDDRTTVRFVRTAEDRLVAIAEVDQRPIEGGVVVLVEVIDRGDLVERAAAVTDADGEADFGPVEPFANLLSPLGRGRYRVRLERVPEDAAPDRETGGNEQP
jgi:hypothetical protein